MTKQKRERIKNFKYTKRKWIAIGGNLHEDVRRYAAQERITIRELTEESLRKNIYGRRGKAKRVVL